MTKVEKEDQTVGEREVQELQSQGTGGSIYVDLEVT